MDPDIIGTSPKPKTVTQPYATLYMKRNAIGPKVINTIVHIKNLLQLKGIFEDEIQEVVLRQDEPKYKEILDKTNGKGEFPVIFIQDVLIGTVSDLEDWVITEKLDALLEKVYATSHGRAEFTQSCFDQRIEDCKYQKQLLEDEIKRAEQQQNIDAIQELKSSIFLLDRDLDAMYKAKEKTKPSSTTPAIPIKSSNPTSKTLNRHDSSAAISDIALGTGKWISSAISSVGSYFSWGPSSHPPQPHHVSSAAAISTSPPKDKDDKNSYVEFEVMQINWYWRQQKRVLRFSKDRFLRINPYTKELRAVHYYHTIQEIAVTGKTFMTISFGDNSQPEYYQSVDIEKIVSTITEKGLPTVIPVTYHSE